MNRAWQLLSRFGLTVGLVLILCWLNPNRGTSPDSVYYLASAKHLLAGNGYTVLQEGKLVWNSIFPPAYSALIAAVAGLTSLPLLWASKVVNLLALGASGWLWLRRLQSRRATWLLSIWWLGSFLKISTYTWSETVFLVLLAEWTWALYRLFNRPAFGRMLGLLALGSALFLDRYVGGFVFGLAGLLAFAAWWQPAWLGQQLGLPVSDRLVRLLLILSVAGLTLIRFYFSLNAHLAGSMFGGERFVPTEPLPALLTLLGRSVLNELLLLRDIVPGEADPLVWMGVAMEALVLGLAIRRWHRTPVEKSLHPVVNSLSRFFVLTGGFYIVLLLGLRMVSPFSGPNLRLMAPGTYCLLMALLLWISRLPAIRQRSLRPYWLLLLMGSWLQLLPQLDSGRKLSQVWHQVQTHWP